MRIGILGGTFDPIHNGHIDLASHAADELNLDKVIFVLSPQNPLKAGERALSPALRAALVKKAVRKYPHFDFSGVEMKRKGPSYTIDTLRYFKKKFAPRGTARRPPALFFLAGADQIKNISRWKSSSEVLKLSRFTVMTRPGHRLNRGDRRFLWLPMPPADVSSSEIRRKLKRKESIGHLVPPEIERSLVSAWRQAARYPASRRKRSTRTKK